MLKSLSLRRSNVLSLKQNKPLISKAPLTPEIQVKMIKNGEGCNNCHKDTSLKNGLDVDAIFAS